MNPITTDIRISVSASRNRAAEIVSKLVTGKRYEDIAKDIDLLARLIFRDEQKHLEEIAEDMKPKPSPTQKITPKFVKPKKQQVEEQEGGTALDAVPELPLEQSTDN